jgi:hypothetical protein
MKTLLQTFDQLSNFTSNLGLKFWLWPLETIIHRSYSEGFEYKIFTRPNVVDEITQKNFLPEFHPLPPQITTVP